MVSAGLAKPRDASDKISAGIELRLATLPMNIPSHLVPLVEQGLIQEVIRPLRSGKEAQVYLVLADGEERVAKVYKDSHHRSFKHRSDYTEGRTVRNSRDQRAMRKQSKYGKSRDEEAWRSAEADIIYRLRAAEVTVPEPFAFVENVLIMELVRGPDGEPAPRLADIHPSPAEARDIFEQLLADTVKMLCAGVVHGDLGEYNVLLGADGPVIIDFPQAVDPAVNRNAKRILLRDISNLDDFLSRHTRKRVWTRYGAEMWSLYEKQLLSPTSRLTGKPPRSSQPSGNALLEEMEALEREAKARREALGLPPPRPARAPIFKDKPKPAPEATSKSSTGRRRRRRRGAVSSSEESRTQDAQPRTKQEEPKRDTTPSASETPGKSTRSRRRNRNRNRSGKTTDAGASAVSKASEGAAGERKPRSNAASATTKQRPTRREGPVVQVTRRRRRSPGSDSE